MSSSATRAARLIVPIPRDQRFIVDMTSIGRVEALLECIEFSGVDLLNISSKLDFQERLRLGRIAYERSMRRTESRPKLVLGIMGGIAAFIGTIVGADVWVWLKAHFP